MSDPVRIVLGLGNPGAQYAATRHNAGFLVCDELARRHRAGAWQKRWEGEAAEIRLDGAPRTWLLKPLTFMNLSGAAAQAAMAALRASPQDLLVLVDDIHLPLGDLRLRADGSAGGHNGLKDIQARIGAAYPRLRLGVGAPPPGIEQVAYVLQAFPESDRADVALMVAKAADGVEAWLRTGFAAASRFNGPLRPPPPRPKAPRPEAPPLPQLPEA